MVFEKPSRAAAYLDHLQREIRRHYACIESHPSTRLQNLESIANYAEFWRALSAHVTAEELSRAKEIAEWTDQQLAHQPIPSPLEPQLSQYLLSQLCSDVTKAASRLGLSIPAQVVFGTLLTGDVNAHAIYVEESDYLVLVDSGTFAFSWGMAKIVAGCMPIQEQDDRGVWLGYLTDADEVSVEMTKAFGELLCTYLVGGPNAGLFQDTRRKSLAHGLCTGLELFMIAHEYGHIIARHIGSQRRTQSTLEGVGIEEICRSSDEEFEADIIGAYLLQEVQAKHCGSALSFAGAEMFFAMAGVIERLGGLVRISPITRLRKTHPTAHERSFQRQSIGQCGHSSDSLHLSQ